MQLHTNQRIRPDTRNSGKQTTIARQQKGARHKAEIRISHDDVSGKLESDDKWWILAMTALLIAGILAAIWMIKTL